MTTSIPSVCRCCFAYEDGPPDFKEIQHEPIAEHSTLQISDFLVLFAGITLNSHQYAAHICPVCEMKLRAAFEFRELIIAANIKSELTDTDERGFVIKDDPDKQNDAQFSEVYLSEEQMFVEPSSVTLEEDVKAPSRKKRKVEIEEAETLKEAPVNSHVTLDIESTFTCPVCDEVLNTYRQFKEHRNLEQCKSIHNRVCNLCQQQTKKGYLKHIVEAHPNYKPNTCAFCSRGFQHAFKLNNHLISHIESKKFKCCGCGEAYQSVKHLRSHINTVKHPSRYSCPVCGLGFEQIRLITAHLSETHADIRMKTFPCPNCNRIFVMRKYFDDHMCTGADKLHCDSKEGRSCDDCPDLEFRDDEHLACHQIAEHENPDEKYPCKQCTEEFDHKYQLDRHCANVHQDNMVQCDDCGKCFPSRQRLRVHKIVHSDVRDVKCPHCPGMFKDRRYLKQHIALIHSGKKKFKCDICERMFGTMGHLKCHMGTHFENLRRFECELCQKKFVRVIDRDRHIQRTHRDERPHKCDMCPKAYYAGNHLREHQRSAHTDVRFECKHCGNRYARAKSLVEHIFSHLGYKPFNCPAIECGQGFVKKESFKKHLVKTHSIQFDEAAHGFKTSFQEILKSGLKEAVPDQC